MLLFYEGADALVTERWLQVWYPRYGEFLISDLGEVYVVRGGRDALTIRVTVTTGGMSLAAAFAWPMLDSPRAVLGAIATLGAATAVTAFRWLRYPPTFELWGDYQGLFVRLYRCHDRQVFGQVSRAVQRAREHAWSERLRREG